jgi:Spy/CpxP family protein refolding chaperone
MRKIIAAAILVGSLVIGGAAAVSADPSFGPGAGQGQGNNGPHETPGTRCHPPGQTDDRPECE